MNFLRKHSCEYIFNSRIKIYDRNLKYRHKIIEGVKNPQGFNMLKDFWPQEFFLTPKSNLQGEKMEKREKGIEI